MKDLICSLALMCICCLLVSCGQQEPSGKRKASPPVEAATEAQPAAMVGRFQVISATRSAQLGGATEHLIIKVDTVTGKAWMYQEATIETGLAAEPQKLGALGWVEIPDSLSESIQDAEATIRRMSAGPKATK